MQGDLAHNTDYMYLFTSINSEFCWKCNHSYSMIYWHNRDEICYFVQWSTVSTLNIDPAQG